MLTGQHGIIFYKMQPIGRLAVLSVLSSASHGVAAESSHEFAPLVCGVRLHIVQPLAVLAAQDD